MSEVKELTGYATIDRPWMKFYPPMLMNLIKFEPQTIRQYLDNEREKRHLGLDRVMIEYYGSEFTWAQLYAESDRIAKSLKVLGVKEGDQLPMFIRLVPEFLPLLLAAEKVGASLLARDNTLEENVDAVKKSGADMMFAHTYLSQDELKAYAAGGVKKAILLDPLRSTKRENLPDYIAAHLDTFTPDQPASGDMTMTWDEFLALGDDYQGEVGVPADPERVLYRCYTSGSTGPSKQVIHSAANMIGILCQLNFWASGSEKRPVWLTAVLPSALVAVVVCMLLLPLASDNYTMISPFCAEEDIDLEVMRTKPNGWSMIPEFCEVLMRSERIPADYDLSHLVSTGAGSEALNNKQLHRMQKWLTDHKCQGRFTIGYGSSESGSGFTLPMSPQAYGDGMVNVPMPLSVVSVFKPGTTEELKYGEVGEICKMGPGNMMGYDIPEQTAKALVKHPDGNIWLHMGDIGRMDENGVIYVMTRGESPRYGGGELWIQPMENKVADADIAGIDDLFFVNVPDTEHEKCFLPYMFVILNEGYTVDDIREEVNAALAEHEHPVQIIPIKKRPFFHFKTDRIGLSKAILAGEYAEA